MSDSEGGRCWFEAVRCGESVDELVVVKLGNLVNRKQIDQLHEQEVNKKHLMSLNTQ